MPELDDRLDALHTAAQAPAQAVEQAGQAYGLQRDAVTAALDSEPVEAEHGEPFPADGAGAAAERPPEA